MREMSSFALSLLAHALEKGGLQVRDTSLRNVAEKMWSAGIQEPSDIVGTPIESIIKEMSKQDKTSIQDRVTILITQMPKHTLR